MDIPLEMLARLLEVFRARLSFFCLSPLVGLGFVMGYRDPHIDILDVFLNLHLFWAVAQTPLRGKDAFPLFRPSTVVETGATAYGVWLVAPPHYIVYCTYGVTIISFGILPWF